MLLHEGLHEPGAVASVKVEDEEGLDILVGQVLPHQTKESQGRVLRGTLCFHEDGICETGAYKFYDGHF